MAKEFGAVGRLRSVHQVRPARRDLSILQALDWAFRVEWARLDFSEEFSICGASFGGADPIWVMMQRGAIGCQIDGGGFSEAHDDAQVIASFVAALPVERGGPQMASYLATLARAGLQPDWMRDARQRCVPRAWGAENQHGVFARTEVAETIITEERGRKVKRDVLFCPVTYTPTAAQIGRARRQYLDWWGALLDLRADLVISGALRTVRLTSVMPPLNPWIAQDAVITTLVDAGP